MPDDSFLLELATLYYSCGTTDSLLRTFATRLGTALGAATVRVWMPREEEGLVCRARWSPPGAMIESSGAPEDASPLLEAMERAETIEWRADQGDPDDLGHLAPAERAKVRDALFVPLPGPRGALGVAEVLNPQRDKFGVASTREAARITALALERSQQQEAAESSQFLTIERLTSLYDLSRVFHSTLELGDLLPVIADKIRDLLRAEAVNLWLVDAKARKLQFAAQSGEDPTTQKGDSCALGEGTLGKAADRGEPVLVENAAEDEDLEKRRARAPEFELLTLAAAPLRRDEQVLGIVEAVNKADGQPFNDEELFFLANVSEQAAIAIHNAQLLDAERKVRQLDALLQISREITSTLNLDHVLASVVQRAASVVRSDRCVIGYFDRGRFVLGGVSGEEEIPETEEMDDLRKLLETIASHPDSVLAKKEESGWVVEPPSEEFSPVEFLERHGYEGLYAVPLRDEQGPLGAIVVLSSEADFLGRNERETVEILAGQATVAVRNAQLYQQVPLAGLFRPLARKRQHIGTLPRRRWLDVSLRVGAVVLLLIAVPWKLRIDAVTRVVPAQRRLVTSAVNGLVERVYVHEGSRVQPGQELARLEDSADQLALVRASSQLAQAQRALSEAEFRQDAAASSRARLDVERYSAEERLYRERIEESHLRSPIAGVVVTPHMEEKVGERLNPGDRFCEVVEEDRMAAEMSVPEAEVANVRPGAPVDLKLNSFPTVLFHGTVERVGEQTETSGGERYFLVRALFPNPGDRARDGMAGEAKITGAGGYAGAGWYPVGYVLFRAPARWIWEKLWGWLP